MHDLFQEADNGNSQFRGKTTEIVSSESYINLKKRGYDDIRRLSSLYRRWYCDGGSPLKKVLSPRRRLQLARERERRHHYSLRRNNHGYASTQGQMTEIETIFSIYRSCLDIRLENLR